MKLNEQADRLAKAEAINEYKFAEKPYEFAHSTVPYYYKKAHGLPQQKDLTMVLFQRCFETHIIKYKRENSFKNNGTTLFQHK